MKLGERIRELRITKGLTQIDLAKGLVTPSMISQIESGKANPSYHVLSEISKKLETPLENFLTDIEDQMNQQSVMKVARALFASQKYRKAASMFQSLLKYPSFSLEQAAALRLDLSECYLHEAQFDQAEHLCDEAFEMYRRQNNAVGMIRTLHLLGQLEFQQKRFHVAIYYWRRAHELFGQVEFLDPFAQSVVLLDLGNVYLQYGDPALATKYFQQADELLSDTTHVEQITEAYLGMAKSALKAGAFEKACEFADHSTSLATARRHIKASIDVKMRVATVQVQENLDEALSLLADCVNRYQKHNFKVEAIDATGKIARLHLQKGDFEKCFELCEHCISELPKNTLALASVVRTKAIADAATGQIDRAISEIDASIAMFQTHEVWSEVAETYSILGDLYHKQGEHDKAILALHQMKKYIEQNLKSRGIIL
ncbi:helix-turn-helix domain-containing protein [Tumebacillus avium]|uniref:helix-turn-helix domain-containing protein n=1 Tax=Tumebacillus avium TaxID=1903704 RepID=UPI0012FD0858|nr:helix-turn-helix domain-containing protein [Tumebacillus avium]